MLFQLPADSYLKSACSTNSLSGCYVIKFVLNLFQNKHSLNLKTTIEAIQS